MKPRVLVFAPSLTAVSGVSTHINYLLGSDLTKDFELIHFQVGSEGRNENRFQKLVRVLFSPWQLAYRIVRHRPAIIHINTSMDPKAFWRDLVYLLVARILRCRVLTQTHGGALPQTFFPGSPLRTWALRKMLIHSNAVTVLSTEEHAAYSAFDDRIRLYLVPNAIRVPFIVDRTKPVNIDTPLRLVYLGRLIASKGLFDAVEAVGLLTRSGQKPHFSIAGSGPDEPALRDAVSQAGLDHCIHFAGSVFGEVKWDLLLDNDIFVFPTYHKEGLPYSLLEAMAAGCVPVTTSVGAIADVIQNGVHGIIVPAKDPAAIAAALAALSEDRGRLAEMANACRGRVAASYSITRLSTTIDRLYREMQPDLRQHDLTRIS